MAKIKNMNDFYRYICEADDKGKELTIGGVRKAVRILTDTLILDPELAVIWAKYAQGRKAKLKKAKLIK